MTLRLSLRSFALACVVFIALSGRARAQADATFSGAMGAPIRLTLNAPVTYLITTASVNSRLYFDLQGAGSFFTGATAVTGTITYSVNNGAPATITSFGNSFGFGALGPTDFLLVNLNAANTVAVGDTVRLLAGTLATTSNASGAPPPSRAYQTFVTDGNGTRLDALDGLSVPEPATWALLSCGAAGWVLALRRRVCAV